MVGKCKLRSRNSNPCAFKLCFSLHIISKLHESHTKVRSSVQIWMLCIVTRERSASDLIVKFLFQGGFDMICSGRDKIETPEQVKSFSIIFPLLLGFLCAFCHMRVLTVILLFQFKQAEETASKLDLDGLVVIGGDDSNTNACLLAENFRYVRGTCSFQVVKICSSLTCTTTISANFVPCSHNGETLEGHVICILKMFPFCRLLLSDAEAVFSLNPFISNSFVTIGCELNSSFLACI